MIRKRLLVLTPRFPYPTIGGDRIRILHLCRALSERYELTLLSQCETREEMQFEPKDGLFSRIERVFLPRWRSYLNTALAIPSNRPLQLAYYESAQFRTRLHELVAQNDLTLAHLIRTGQYIENLAVPKILEMTDAISMNYLRMRDLSGNNSLKRLVYRMEQRRLMAYELTTIRQFHRVWLTSQTDRNFLDPSHAYPIDVIPNGTNPDSLPFHAPAPDARAIVFIGNMASLQNEDACHYFAQQILPGIRAQANVVFRIVGNAPATVQQRFRKYPGVEMTGRLQHIQSGVEGAFCGVCSVRAAAGIQNKILEYMALGLPCVTSITGLGGVEAEPEKELLVYRDPSEAIHHILALYADHSLRLRLASAGRKLVCEKYDWRMVYRSIVDSAEKLV